MKAKEHWRQQKGKGRSGLADGAASRQAGADRPV